MWNDELYGLDTAFADQDDPQPRRIPPTAEELARWQRQGRLFAICGIAAAVTLLLATFGSAALWR